MERDSTIEAIRAVGEDLRLKPSLDLLIDVRQLLETSPPGYRPLPWNAGPQRGLRRRRRRISELRREGEAEEAGGPMDPEVKA
jgi:hypothetical protein